MFIFMVYNFRECAIIPSVDPALFPNVQIPTLRNYVSGRLSINQGEIFIISIYRVLRPQCTNIIFWNGTYN